MKQYSMIMFGILAMLALAPVLGASSVQADLTKKFPPVNLINDLGQFTPMKVLSYKSSNGGIGYKLPDNWYETTSPSLTIHMEKIFKLRVAEDTSIYKTVAKTSGSYHKGMEPRFGLGPNDDWDNFVQYKSPVYDGATNYKVTWLLNQHNPDCFDPAIYERFVFDAGEKRESDTHVFVYFTDGTWAEYVAETYVIGANAYDNPC